MSVDSAATVTFVALVAFVAFVALVANVAVVALPVHDPEEPETLPVTSPTTAPVNVVDERFPVEGLKSNLVVDVFGPTPSLFTSTG